MENLQMPADTATQTGVVDPRAAQMADILKSREEQIDREMKDGGTAEGIAVFGRDTPDGDPQRPESIPEDDWAAMSDEAKNQALAEAARSDDPPADDPADEPAAEPRRFKGKVDGQEVEFDEEAVIQAGLKTLQKETAADKRLEEAAKAKEEAERLRRAAEEAASRAAPSEPARSQQDVMLAKEKLREIVKKIQYGTEDEAADALAEYGAEMAKAGQTQTVTGTEINNILDLREAQKYVRENYADVVGDENLKELFVTKVNRKLQAGDARPYLDIAKDVGDELRTWKGTPPPSDATRTTTGASREAVRERKTQIVQVPSAAARQPMKTQPKAPTASDTVAQMRAVRDKASGRPTA